MFYSEFKYFTGVISDLSSYLKIRFEMAFAEIQLYLEAPELKNSMV